MFFTPGERDIVYAKAWLALCTPEILLLESIFLYDQLLFFRFLEREWRSLLKAIFEKRIPKEVGLSERMRSFLCALPVSEERLAYVRQELEKGMEGIAARLWPNLLMCSGISGPAFEVEESLIRKYTGRVPLHYFSYVASECQIGAAIWKERYSYVLLPESAFYEFIPYDGGASGETIQKTLLPGELEVGGLYEIVITNYTGFYRYRLGDIVKVTGFYRESPIIEFMFRKNQVLNIAGEKMNVNQAERAVGHMNHRYDLELTHYCLANLSGRIPARYGCICFTEQKLRKEKIQEAEACFDNFLKEENLDYKDLRIKGSLDRPELIFLNSGQYADFQKENGLSGGHSKPKHAGLVFSEEEWKKWRERM